MMMKSVLCLISILVVCGLAHAQQSSFETPTEKIYYSRRLPLSVAKQMPRGAKSRFFGISKLKFNGQIVSLHIYDVAKADFSIKAASYGAKDYAPNERAFHERILGSYYGAQRVRVDLFISRKANQSSKFQRINSFQFNYIRFVNPNFPIANYETVGVDILWLDPQPRRIPIIKINICNPNAVLGAVGLQMFVVFPDGLVGTAVAEGFGYGHDNSSEHLSWGWQFNGIDAKGYLTVQSYLSSSSDKAQTLLAWDGKYFTPIKSTTVTYEP